ECRPRLRMLEAGWWRNVRLDDILERVQAASVDYAELKESLPPLLVSLRRELEEYLNNLPEGVKLSLSEEETQCVQTLALEYCVQKLAQSLQVHSTLRYIENIVTNFMEVLQGAYRQLGE